MEEGRHIPGFYYDREKKKYFRIQAGHNLPEGAKHAASNVVKEIRETKKRKRIDNRQAKLLKETITLAPILRHALTRSTLISEQGSQRVPAREKARSSVFAPQLRQEACIGLHDCQACHQRIKCHDFDVISDGRLIYCAGDDARSFVYTENIFASTSKHRCNFGLIQGAASSVCCNDEGHIIATSATARSHNVLLTYSDWNDDHAHSAPMVLSVDASADVETLTSALNPHTSQALVLTSHENRSAITTLLDTAAGRISSKRKGKDDRDCEWLSSSVALICSRNGTVKLWDIRSGGTVSRYIHSGAASTVIPGEHRHSPHAIWVGGPTCVASYDLRMPDLDSTSRQISRVPHQLAQYARTHDKPMSTRQHSAAIVSIPVTHDPKLAIWSGPGLLAVSDGGNRVRLHSTVDGALVRTLEPPFRGDDCASHWISRMRVTQDAHGGEQLLVACGRTVYRWGTVLKRRRSRGDDDQRSQEGGDGEGREDENETRAREAALTGRRARTEQAGDRQWVGHGVWR